MKKQSLCLLLLTLLSASFSFAHGPLLAENLWIREAPPNAQMLAGYGSFTNTGRKEITLIGAYSQSFQKIEMHRTTVHKDMVRMAQQKQITIEPGGTLKFEPNGYHWMLMGPTEPFRSGSHAHITLQLEDGTTQELFFLVSPHSTRNNEGRVQTK